ncbi:hypothetical protein CPLU01_09777 [Colletotrichum plurivorum]|uniref:Uncharacterized protein n=1 Tax=Colletotrichum plurivorum TaxID=2175906 RepID=A0A8H6K8B4_9PEZI|nr:hypothetical protein CPLU01_09777 [Colletotrichum plurivorum]
MSKFSQFFGSSLAKGKDVAYSKLSADEEEKSIFEREHKPPKPRTPAALRVAIITTRVIVTILAIYGLYSLIAPHLPYTPRDHSSSCNCGDTIEEALANGCAYDSLAAAWLPPHCRSAALTAEFESLGPNEPDESGNTWGYWHDRNQTRPMSLAEVSQLPEEARQGHHARFFSTHQWHILHCVFYWRKMWESARCARGVKGAACGEGGRLVVERRYDTLMHIEHCMTMFMKRDTLDSVAAEAGVALHSDELHVAKPHRHGDESQHEVATGGSRPGHPSTDPYDKNMEGHTHVRGGLDDN